MVKQPSRAQCQKEYGLQVRHGRACHASGSKELELIDLGALEEESEPGWTVP